LFKREITLIKKERVKLDDFSGEFAFKIENDYPIRVERVFS
jgi:hypothetical protein